MYVYKVMSSVDRFSTSLNGGTFSADSSSKASKSNSKASKVKKRRRKDSDSTPKKAPSSARMSPAPKKTTAQPTTSTLPSKLNTIKRKPVSVSAPVDSISIDDLKGQGRSRYTLDSTPTDNDYEGHNYDPYGDSGSDQMSVYELTKGLGDKSDGDDGSDGGLYDGDDSFFDYTLFFGDLNYRLDCPRLEVCICVYTYTFILIRRIFVMSIAL